MRNPGHLALRWCVAATALLAVSALAQEPDGACGAWRQVHFSPNGRHLLTQDRCEIIVLDTEPLAPRMRIAADLAANANFSPDSKQLVFVRSDTNKGSSDQVEIWSIDERKLISSKPVPSCKLRALSPDGKLCACVEDGKLTVSDLDMGGRVLEERKFSRPFMSGPPRMDDNTFPEYLLRYLLKKEMLPATTRRLEFSPDGRFLVAWPMGKGTTVVWQVLERRKTALSGALAVLGRIAFYKLKDAVFLADGRLAMSYEYCYLGFRTTCSTRVASIPDGQWIKTANIPAGRLTSTSDPDVLIVEVPGRWERRTPTRTIAVHLKTGESLDVDSAGLMDVFGDQYVVQVAPGRLELRKWSGKRASNR